MGWWPTQTKYEDLLDAVSEEFGAGWGPEARADLFARFLEETNVPLSAWGAFLIKWAEAEEEETERPE